MGWFTGLLWYWKAAIIVAVLAILGAGVWAVTSHFREYDRLVEAEKDLKAEVAAQVKLNADNKAAYDLDRKLWAEALEIAGKAVEAVNDAQQDHDDADDDINNAPPSDDAPVAPVLERLLDRLRERPADSR